MRTPNVRPPLERRVFWLALLAGAPAIALLLALGLHHGASAKIWVTAALAVLLPWLAAALVARETVVHQLRTLANLVSALREQDYSLRGRGHEQDDALGEVLADVNLLGDALKERRLSELEASALLTKVIEEIEVVVLAFDARGRLRLANRAGERLLGKPSSLLEGESAASLGLDPLLDGEAHRRVELSERPWELRRSTFRQQGLEHRLVVLTDLERVLAEEDRIAWQRLVRVLSHEINNSLAPIQSIAQSLAEILDSEQRPAQWEAQLSKGLAVIARRSEALARFMRSYATLAKLPPPSYGTVEIAALVRRVAALEKRLEVLVREGRAVTVEADPDQLEQLLINLVRNAADAALEIAGARVWIGWTELPGEVELVVNDEGPGLADSANLFVPFFTTKEGGSGIGLVLSRQIAQAHRGTLSLENARDRRGCEARVRLSKHRVRR